VLGDEPPAAWACDLDQLIFRGAPPGEVRFLQKQFVEKAFRWLSRAFWRLSQHCSTYPRHEYGASDEQEGAVPERQGWTKGRPEQADLAKTELGSAVFASSARNRIAHSLLFCEV
jgi:hypothetical protein